MMKLWATVLLLTLTACATGYKSKGWMGGFSETWLAPDVAIVEFAGNGFASPERAADFALLRAADLTVAAGYRYFLVSDAGSGEATSYHYQPGTTTTLIQQPTARSPISATTTTTPGYMTAVTRPRSRLAVMMFAEPPEGQRPFEAAFVQRSIRSKYGMDEL